MSAQPLELIRVRGQVQGVGFRPLVARLARQLGLAGWVKNDADGVVIALAGDRPLRDRFVSVLFAGLPPLATVQGVSRTLSDPPDMQAFHGFRILESEASASHEPGRRLGAAILPDAVVCSECSHELLSPADRRFGYAFTTCTRCGPRFSIMRALPWDRERTTLAAFGLCAQCEREYADAADRRYHAEPIACPACGPRVTLFRPDGTPHTRSERAASDAIDAAARLLAQGAIVAVKGIGGFQLLADATQAASVEQLRRRKHRPHKPLALMARDLEMVQAYCEVSGQEQAALEHSAAPIVLLQARVTPQGVPLSDAIAPTPTPNTAGGRRYGFMLPASPLHLLLLRQLAHPVVCTSGNRSAEPPVIDDLAAFTQLGDIADWVLGHDRPIRQRVDDSVTRVVGGKLRVMRRARGFAPAPLALPPGFTAVAAGEAVFAAGGDGKAAICLSRREDLVLGPHLGDLDAAASYAQYVEQSARLCELLEHRPTRIATDNHPGSRAAGFGRALAEELQVPWEPIMHHHAHFAACLGEHEVALDSPACFGLVLDGIGMGADGQSLWGAELLVGGYAQVERVATLQPVALLGGDRAAREPWRCLYAQLRAACSWDELAQWFGDVECVEQLLGRPIPVLEQMLASGVGAPLASSCGRLFDAVAAALGVAREVQSYEGEAAQLVEALVRPEGLEVACAESARGDGYRLRVRGWNDERVDLDGELDAIGDGDGDLDVIGDLLGDGGVDVIGNLDVVVVGDVDVVGDLDVDVEATNDGPVALTENHLASTPGWVLDPAEMWLALLSDLALGLDRGLIAARFHVALAEGLARLCDTVAQQFERQGRPVQRRVALSGGCLQNAILHERLEAELGARGFSTLTHAAVPANDGGLAFGQALVSLARAANTPLGLEP
jgi:hydrogenase maturation protein HypF